MSGNNIWLAICEHLGVEPNEPFKLALHGREPHPKNLYKIVTNGKVCGLYFYVIGRDDWYVSDISVNGLLSLDTTAIQEPWKPKSHEDYWTVLWTVHSNNEAELEITQTYYALSCSTDLLRVGLGNCFKTKEQAQRNKFKVFERLMGKTWTEWCEENGYQNAEASQAD